MRRYWCALFAVVFGLAMFGSDASAGVWDEGSEEVRVQSVTSVSSYTPAFSCPTFFAQVEIESVGKKEACIGGGPRSVVIYYENNAYRVAASSSPGGKRSLVAGVCTQGLTCFYSAETDAIIERQFGAHYSKYLIISRNFSDRTTWQFLPQQHRWGWQYQHSDANTMLIDANGDPFPVETIGMSANGRWLTAELYEKGIVLIDLRNESTRRITDSGYLYGRGMDPLHQYAISDDGSAVIVTGHNSSFHFYQITPQCGRVYRQTDPSTFSNEITRCPQMDTGVTRAVVGSHVYSDPHFNQLSRQFTVQAQLSYGGSRQITAGRGDKPTSMGYLALGESFASGQGETSDDFYRSGTNEPFEKCHVSTRSYAYLLAIPSTQNIACSGAQIPDIVGAPTYRGQGERLKEFLKPEGFETAKAEALRQFIPGRTGQVDFVRKYQPDALTVSIGGNDIGLMDKLRSCTSPGTCEWAQHENAGKTAKEIQALYSRLVELYGQLQSASPKTKIYVVGYPDVIIPDGVCDTITATLLTEEERRYMRRTVDYVNQVVAAAARVAGVSTVDTGSVFGRHALCGGDSTPAMNGFRFGDDGAPIAALPELRVIGSESFHPTPFGHSLIANAIRGQTDTLQRTYCFDQCAEASVIPDPPAEWTVMPHTARTVRTEFTQSALDVSAKTVQLNLAGHLFAANSAVSVSIDGEPIMTTFQVGSRGELAETSLLNTQLKPGYYTFRMIGETDDAEPIEAYQQVLVSDRSIKSSPISPPNTQQGSSTGLMRPEQQLIDRQPSSYPKNPTQLSRALEAVIKPISAGVQSGSALQTTSVEKDIEQSKGVNSKRIDVFTTAMLSVIGIIGTCLVFVLLLRK